MIIPRTSCDDVEFWDGERYSRELLDEYLPGLGDYASTHPYLAERVPYDMRREAIAAACWIVGATGVFILLVVTGLLGFQGPDVPVAIVVFAGAILLTFGTRFLWSANEANKLPTICATNGHIEVRCRNPSWEMEDLIWSAPLADIEWQLGAAWKATRPTFRFAQRYRRIVLLKGPPLSWTHVRKRGFRKEHEYYGCGWTGETQAMWLALFRIVESNSSGSNEAE